MHLLILDDEEAIGTFLADVARGSGWTAEVTMRKGDFRNAFRRLPDAVMLDLHLGETDGISEMRFLAQCQFQGSLGLMSGFDKRVLASAQQVGESLGLNVVDVIEKPMRVTDARNILTRFERAMSAEMTTDTRPGARLPVASLTVADIALALSRGEMELYYQPIVTANSLTVCHLEALIRWNHPELGLVMPGAFMAMAETDQRTIDRLTDWVLTTAATHSRALRKLNMPVTIAVNISGANLSTIEYPDHVEALLAGLEPGSLMFEVTESVATGNPVVADILTRLRLKGFQLSIDDFGTGYSSLEALRRIPFSSIKVDQTFVADLGSSKDSLAIVKSVLALARSMNLTSIAEGVETSDVAQTLIELGVDELQGYHYSRPIPFPQLVLWLRSEKTGDAPEPAQFDVADRTETRMQHVVIVDNDRAHLNLMTEIVEGLQTAVAHPFSSSTSALSWCADHDVDCFLLEQHMPAPDGMEMIRLIRNMPRFALVPIVIVTGLSDREVRRRVLRAGANDFLEKPVDYQEVVSRLSTLLALHDARKQLMKNLNEVEASLVEEETRSRAHAERLEALWRMVNNPSLRDEELLQAMLRQAGAAILPGRSFYGFLVRFDGSDVVVEATSVDERLDENFKALPRVGLRVPIRDTMSAAMPPSASTHCWDDVLTDPGLPISVRAREFGLRAIVVTRFQAGADQYALTFAALLPFQRDFGDRDRAYIEIIAAFFSNHFQARWQAERLRFQLEHDSLTELRNRVKLRIAGRAAFQMSSTAGIAIVDIDRFRNINRAHGHITGDAILVEVATALAAQTSNGEIAARVGGDSFAVLFPSVPSREWLTERLAAYKAVFEKPFSTGDRDGIESVPVTATITAAIAPHDGASFDELLLRAEAIGIDMKAARPGNDILAGKT